MFEFIVVNKEEILNVASHVIAVASVVAKLTPTRVDNNVLSVLIKFIDTIAFNRPHVVLNGKAFKEELRNKK